MADAKTYSEEEHNALLAEVADLKTKVAALAKANEDSEVDSKIAAAAAEIESKVTDLQTQLDAKVLEAEAAKTANENFVAWLEGERTAAAEAAELASRKDARTAQVKEVASFPDEYLVANADRFAAMSDEAFEAALEDWKEIASKSAKASDKGDALPSATAMTASRSTDENISVLHEVLGLRFQGVDVRNV